MREHPWHQPRPTSEHYRRFSDLVDLHALTRKWVQEIDVEQPPTPHHLRRVLSPAARERFLQLESISENSVPDELDSFLDESGPDELLEKLEYTIWAVQSWTLRNIFEKTPEKEHDALRNILERVSWAQGRKCSDDRWGKNLKPRRKTDLRGILGALQDSPLSRYPHRSPFMIRRAVEKNVELELLHCPHRNTFLEVHSASDDLCSLQAHWIRGFVYGLNTTVLVEYTVRTHGDERSRCELHLKFHQE